VKIFISQAGKIFPRVPSSSCAEYKVDRLVLKAMLDESPKAQISDGKAAFLFWQRVEDNAFHPSVEAAVSAAKDNLICYKLRVCNT
jgi:hypothetical protein